MIEYMIQFANNFEADCRDGFVSNDEAYTELAIEGVDLDKKLRKWCEGNGIKFKKIEYVNMLVNFSRYYYHNEVTADSYIVEFIWGAKHGNN